MCYSPCCDVAMIRFGACCLFFFCLVLRARMWVGVRVSVVRACVRACMGVTRVLSPVRVLRVVHAVLHGWGMLRAPFFGRVSCMCRAGCGCSGLSCACWSCFRSMESALLFFALLVMSLFGSSFVAAVGSCLYRSRAVLSTGCCGAARAFLVIVRFFNSCVACARAFVHARACACVMRA